MIENGGVWWERWWIYLSVCGWMWVIVTHRADQQSNFKYYTCCPKYEFFYSVCKSQSTYWVETLHFIAVLQNRVPSTKHSWYLLRNKHSFLYKEITKKEWCRNRFSYSYLHNKIPNAHVVVLAQLIILSPTHTNFCGGVFFSNIIT